MITTRAVYGLGETPPVSYEQHRRDLAGAKLAGLGMGLFAGIGLGVAVTVLVTSTMRR